METKGKIYRLECPDGHFYIGSTKQSLNKRLSSHKSLSKKIENKLYNYINNIGWDNVKIILLEEFNFINRKELLLKETNYINHFIHDTLCLNTSIPYNPKYDSIKSKNGTIYKLVSPDNYFYIGSSLDYLSKRIAKHKSDFKKLNSKLYNHFSKFDWKCIKVIILEKINNISKEDLLNKEYEIINKEYSNLCLNSILKNKIKNLENRKNYRIKNREKNNLKKRKYEIINKEKISKRKSEYYKNNIEIIKNKHLTYYQNNKEKCKERDKEYYKNNKDKKNEYRKKYNELNKEKLREYRKKYYELKIKNKNIIIKT